MSWQLSTARMEVLDDGRQRRYCQNIFVGCCSQPPPHRPMWSMFKSAVADHGSFPLLKPLLVVCWCDVTSANRQPNRTALRSQARRRSDRARHVQSSRCPAERLSEVDASGDALSAPITVNNSGIDARNGQAYHGRKTIATNGTRPAALASRASEEHREKWQRRGLLTSRVRPCPGAAGRA